MSALRPIQKRSSNKYIENHMNDSMKIEKALVKPIIKPKSSVCLESESNRMTILENYQN